MNPIQEDKTDKIEIMAKHPHAFSLNEIRRSADEPDIDGGDDLFVSVARHRNTSKCQPQPPTLSPA